MPHLPAEFDTHEAVWIGFPSDAALWLDDLDGARTEVTAFARAIHADREGEEVRLVAADAASVEAATALAGDFATIIEAEFGDIWLRDTGPLIVREGARSIALDYPGNGWGGKYHFEADDDIAATLIATTSLTRLARDWVLEGGAIDVDGAGLLVTTGQCLLNPNRNPELSREEIEARLIADLGIERVLWLGNGLLNDHTDGHVDNLARFVAPGVLALPEPESHDDPNADVYADAYARATAFGVEVTFLPSPGRTERDGAVIAASYMNFYIGNAAVVVPIHGAANDDAAVAAVAELFPDRVVTGLPCGHLLTGGGSFHCISQQVPK